MSSNKYGTDGYGRYKESRSGERFAIEVFPPWHRLFTFRSLLDWFYWKVHTL